MIELPWYNRRIINAGSSGVVYNIDNKAVKLGVIERKEYNRQVYFSHLGLALPIHYYERWMPIPDYIAKELCFIHGYRHDFYGDAGCECWELQADILIMDIAEPVEDTPEINSAAEYLNQYSIAIFGHGRDTRHLNIGKYKGYIVGLDWG